MAEGSVDKNTPVIAEAAVTANDALISNDSVEEVIIDLLTVIASQCGTDQGLAAVFEPRSQRFVIRTSIGLPKDAIDQFASLRARQYGPGPAFTLRKPVVIKDMEVAEEYAMFRMVAQRVGVRSVISTPFFTVDGAPLGILCLFFKEARVFSDNEIQLAQFGAKQLATYARTCQVLANGKQHLARMTHNLPIIIWSADKHGRVIRPQPAWESFSGMVYEEYRDYRWQAAVHPKDWKRIEDLCLDSLTSGSNFEVECRLRRADGVYRHMQVHATAWKTDPGEVGEWTGYCEDRTDVFQLKEQLAVATSRTTRILSILAHDLRNPLSTLALAARVVQNPGTVQSQLAHFGQIIERQTRKMAQVVDDLLDVTRIARGRLVLDKRPVLMRSVVEAAVEVAHLYVKERRHRLSVSIPKEPLRVLGDKVRLMQALSAMISHAADTMPAGGHIAVLLGEAEGNIVLKIEHDGGDIDPAAGDALFELAGSHSADPVARDKDLNLSLALIKSIVIYHGGNISAASRGTGAGATYSIILSKMN